MSEVIDNLVLVAVVSKPTDNQSYSYIEKAYEHLTSDMKIIQIDGASEDVHEVVEGVEMKDEKKFLRNNGLRVKDRRHVHQRQKQDFIDVNGIMKKNGQGRQK